MTMHSPRALLAQRYELQRPVPSTRGDRGWTAVDVTTGTVVRVAVVDAREAGRLEKLLGARQLHLTGVIQLITEFDRGELPAGTRVDTSSMLAIVEHVTGATLHRQLAAQGPILPFKAVAWCLRLLDALEVLHRRGVAHGGISPRSVIVEPRGRVVPPVLSIGHVAPLAAYCSPERVRGGAPSVADDLWALHATLYSMLTARAPFPTGEPPSALLAALSRGKPRSLGEAELAEPELQRLFDAAFDPNEKGRLSRGEDLRRALDRWERAEVPVIAPRVVAGRGAPRLGNLTFGANGPVNESLSFDDAAWAPEEGEAVALEAPPEPSRPVATAEATGPFGALRVEPPSRLDASAVSPLELSGPAAASGRSPLHPSGVSASTIPLLRRPRPWGLLAVVLVLVGGGFGYWQYGVHRAEEDRAQVEARRSPQAERRAPASASPARPRPRERSPGEKLHACVTSYFPDDSFRQGEDFRFLCRNEDFRETTRLLFSQVKPRVDAGIAAASEPSAPGDVVATTSPDAGVIVLGGTLEVKAAFPDLGWYELAATAIVRQGCCPNPPAVELPTTAGWCQQLEKVVRQLATDSQKPGDLSPTVRVFDEAVACLFANNTPRPYPYAEGLTATQRRAFQGFLTQAAESEALRSSRHRR